jgi:hypothetical protein
MPKVISKKELLRLNPRIDRNKLEESISITKQLADSGVKMSDYQLASPFSRRRNIKQKDILTNNKHTKKYRGL